MANRRPPFSLTRILDIKELTKVLEVALRKINEAITTLRVQDLSNVKADNAVRRRACPRCRWKLGAF